MDKVCKTGAKRNSSKSYSLRLDKMIKEALKIASQYPESGKKTDEENTRVKVVRDYLLFYDFGADEIIVLSIWDASRNDQVQPY
ncbi:MAG: type II toxin-antitoxin system RelE/ParE family toxin [Bacteroidia bacterium]|nr:type II toxin-antitoxin system RelE/ParE family toxin [Bacteroidia bacterium]